MREPQINNKLRQSIQCNKINAKRHYLINEKYREALVSFSVLVVVFDFKKKKCLRKERKRLEQELHRIDRIAAAFYNYCERKRIVKNNNNLSALITRNNTLQINIEISFSYYLL